jgi:hypothetical protein
MEPIIARIEANAAGAGFSSKEVPGFDRVWHRRRFMMSRFGVVDTVITVRTAGVVTRADLENHEKAAFTAALDLKTWIPRGLGSALEVHPITIANQADEGAVEYVRSVMTNRWSAMTMHALVHGEPPQTVLFEGTKLWGAFYVKSIRAQVAALVG